MLLNVDIKTAAALHRNDADKMPIWRVWWRRHIPWRPSTPMATLFGFLTGSEPQRNTSASKEQEQRCEKQTIFRFTFIIWKDVQRIFLYILGIKLELKLIGWNYPTNSCSPGLDLYKIVGNPWDWNPMIPFLGHQVELYSDFAMFCVECRL